jgi:hypothetical protein
MAETVYVLCALLSVICAVSLYRGYRSSRNRLLLWSALCFGFLAANNIFLCVDVILLPLLELHGPFWRNLLSATAGSLLLYGLILELS